MYRPLKYAKTKLLLAKSKDDDLYHEFLIIIKVLSLYKKACQWQAFLYLEDNY